MKLVSLQTASDHLRRDTSDDDADLILKIEGASQMIMDYISDAAKAGWCDSQGEPFEDSSGDAMGVPQRVQSATLVLIGYLFSDRGGDKASANAVPTQWGYGYLPLGVTALLYPLRKPTVV